MIPKFLLMTLLFGSCADLNAGPLELTRQSCIGCDRPEKVSVASEPVLAKERVRVSLALRTANQRADNTHDRITILQQQIERLIVSMTARSAKLHEQIALAENHSEILSNFSGTLVRIESEPVTTGILVSVYYTIAQLPA